MPAQAGNPAKLGKSEGAMRSDVGRGSGGVHKLILVKPE